MTNKEAIEIIMLEYCPEICSGSGKTSIEHCEKCEIGMAIKALEKQIPKKPRETRCALMCANCGHKITEIGCKKLNRFYCKKCGQRLRWMVEEDEI